MRNMNKLYIAIVAILFVTAGVWWWQSADPAPDTDPTDNDVEELYSHEFITVTSPTPNSTVSSPLTATGEARGMWYFEADFPVRIYDDNDTELGVGIATAQGEWMTEDFVPFVAEIQFTEPTTPGGMIVFERDNPSDLPENDDSFSFPIQFASYEENGAGGVEESVSLYLYNEELDTDAEGMVMCSPDSVVATERSILATQSPARAVVELLLAGGVTDAEAAAGLSTEYPLAGVSLSDISLTDGVLTIVLDDPSFATSGGSCRVTILRAQLEKTALQFATVDEVVILPEELFQP